MKAQKPKPRIKVTEKRAGALVEYTVNYIPDVNVIATPIKKAA